MRAASKLASPAHVAVIALGLSLAGCSAIGPRTPDSLARSEVTIFPRPAGSARASAVPALSPPEERADTAPSDGDQFASQHPSVRGFVDAYQNNLRGFLSQALNRATKYLPKMQSILEEEGVPTELAYLPIVESGFRVNAASQAGAVGPWQFIRGTGQRYGLRIDGYVDERRDPVKATRAAARYLRDLYGMFGDWHLSLAAYNTGEGNIARIRDRRKIDDYWVMGARGYLPNETEEFVPRFLAAVEIAKAPEAYGFEVEQDYPLPYEMVRIDRSISLRTVASLSGSSVAAVTELNPALSRGMVPPQGYLVRLPKGTRDRFETAYAQYKSQPQPRAETAVASTRTHAVRRGDTLASISRRYGVSVASLMQANRIRSARGLQAGKVLRIPGSPVTKKAAGPTRLARASRARR